MNRMKKKSIAILEKCVFLNTDSAVKKKQKKKNTKRQHVFWKDINVIHFDTSFIILSQCFFMCLGNELVDRSWYTTKD